MSVLVLSLAEHCRGDWLEGNVYNIKPFGVFVEAERGGGPARHESNSVSGELDARPLSGLGAPAQMALCGVSSARVGS